MKKNTTLNSTSIAATTTPVVIPSKSNVSKKLPVFATINAEGLSILSQFHALNIEVTRLKKTHADTVKTFKKSIAEDEKIINTNNELYADAVIPECIKNSMDRAKARIDKAIENLKKESETFCKESSEIRENKKKLIYNKMPENLYRSYELTVKSNCDSSETPKAEKKEDDEAVKVSYATALANFLTSWNIGKADVEKNITRIFNLMFHMPLRFNEKSGGSGNRYMTKVSKEAYWNALLGTIIDVMTILKPCYKYNEEKEMFISLYGNATAAAYYTADVDNTVTTPIPAPTETAETTTATVETSDTTNTTPTEKGAVAAFKKAAEKSKTTPAPATTTE